MWDKQALLHQNLPSLVLGTEQTPTRRPLAATSAYPNTTKCRSVCQPGDTRAGRKRAVLGTPCPQRVSGAASWVLGLEASR